MCRPQVTNPTVTGPAAYRLRVRGELGPEWSAALGGLAVTPTGDGDTVLSGVVRDQAALHAVLARIRDLALPLLAVDLAGTADGGAPAAPPRED
jgi:hypothetical protein